MKKEIINTVRLTAGFMIFYVLIDLVDWKTVLPTIDFTYILRKILIFIFAGILLYFINHKFNQYLRKKELEKQKQQ